MTGTGGSSQSEAREQLLLVNSGGAFWGAMALTPAEVTQALESAGSDLRFLMDREKVDETVQAKLYISGVSTVRQFAVMFANVDDLRDVLMADFGLDPAAGLADRVKISRVLVAWETAKGRAAKSIEIDRECEMRGEPKVILASDYQGMKATFENRFWELEDGKTPSKHYLEKKLEGVEKNEPRAEPLSEVLTVNEDEGEVLRTVWDASGNLKAIKVGNTILLPSNPEELRRRVVVVGNAWIFVGVAQSNRAYLKGITPQIFQEYLDYLLGRTPWGSSQRARLSHRVLHGN